MDEASPGPILDRGSIDEILVRLRGVQDRISAGLVEIDRNAVVQLLRGSALQGLTRQRWAAAEADLAELWTVYRTYRDGLSDVERRRARRSRPGRAELRELSQALAARPVQLADPRRLLMPGSQPPGSPGAGPTALTLDDAATVMEQALRRITDLVEAVDTAWRRLIPELSAADSGLDALTELHRQVALSDAEDPRLAQVGAELHRLRAAVLTDPLGSDGVPDALTRITAAFADRRRELDHAAAVRQNYGERYREIEAAISRLTQAEADTRQYAAQVTAKVTAAAPALPRQSPRLSAELTALDRSAADWLVRAGQLIALERAVDDAADRVTAVRQAYHRLVERRSELRGLLDAYQAKAARLRRAEDPAAISSYERARTLLWSAPCDLAAAQQAVDSFRRSALGGAS